MANKLKWYHYTAKIILLGLAFPLIPFLILISLAAGDGPFFVIKAMWNDGK